MLKVPDFKPYTSSTLGIVFTKKKKNCEGLNMEVFKHLGSKPRSGLHMYPSLLWPWIRWCDVVIHLTENTFKFTSTLLRGWADGNLENAYICISYVNVIAVEKREALNSLQEELADVQDHVNLTKQVSLICNLLAYPEGRQRIGWNIR